MLDSKEHLMQQLGRDSMETIIRSVFYNNWSWVQVNAEKRDQNHIIGECHDYLPKFYGMNCKFVEIFEDEQLSHQLVLDKNGPLCVVPKGHKRISEAASLHKLELILNDKEFKEREKRDKMKSNILSKHYLDVIGSKEDNQSKIFEFIV